MPDLPSRNDLFQIGRAEVLSRSQARPPGQRISPSEVTTEGSDINIIVASSSGMGEEITRQLGLGIKALFLDGAEDEDLDRLVADRFSPTIVRKGATPALATLSISRSSGLMPALTLPIGTRVVSRSGVEFATTAAASLALASSGPVEVLAQCVVAGLVGNVAEGEINRFVEPPSDPALQVTNDEVAAGGDERETDARLRARARDFFRTARRGILAAIEFGALTVAGVRQAVAVEEVDQLGDPTGRVSLFIADALGQANAALVDAVEAALLEYRGGGVVVDVIGAFPLFVSIRNRLRFLAGVNTTAATQNGWLAQLAYVNALRPSATLEVSGLMAALRTVPGIVVLDDAIVEPVGDLLCPAGRVIRTSLDRMSAE